MGSARSARGSTAAATAAAAPPRATRRVPLARQGRPFALKVDRSKPMILISPSEGCLPPCGPSSWPGRCLCVFLERQGEINQSFCSTPSHMAAASACVSATRIASSPACSISLRGSRHTPHRAETRGCCCRARCCNARWAFLDQTGCQAGHGRFFGGLEDSDACGTRYDICGLGDDCYEPQSRAPLLFFVSPRRCGDASLARASDGKRSCAASSTPRGARAQRNPSLGVRAQ